MHVCWCCSSASHHCAVVEVQRAVSLLPHAGQRWQLQQHSLHPIQHTQTESYTSRPPVCPSLRRANNSVGLQLLLHLPTPHMNTYKGAHERACTHTQRQASLRPPVGLKWRMSGWQSHFLSKQSKPGNTSISCMWATMIFEWFIDKATNVQCLWRNN